MRFEKRNQINKGRSPWNSGKKNIYSEETLKKMSLAKLGKPSYKKGIPLIELVGERRAMEIKKKLSESRKGKVAWNKGNRLYVPNPKIINVRSQSRVIPLKSKCEICGEKNKKLHRHHWDYDKPILVNTLCTTCHKIQHIKDFDNSKYGRKLI